MSSSDTASACGSCTCSASARACSGASSACGPTRSTDRPPACAREVTCDSGAPCTRSASSRGAAPSLAGKGSSKGPGQAPPLFHSRWPSTKTCRSRQARWTYSASGEPASAVGSVRRYQCVWRAAPSCHRSGSWRGWPAAGGPVPASALRAWSMRWMAVADAAAAVTAITAITASPRSVAHSSAARTRAGGGQGGRIIAAASYTSAAQRGRWTMPSLTRAAAPCCGASREPLP